MTSEDKRLAGMRRILRLQTQMRQREEWRLARLERADEELARRRVELVTFMEAETSVSALMAGAASHHLRSVAEKRTVLAQQKRTQSDRVMDQQRRVVYAERLCERLAEVVSRAAEDEDLSATLEADFGRRQASLP